MVFVATLRFLYDVVQVPTATSLRLIADAADTSVGLHTELIRNLRRDVTPRGETYNVRVPAGRSKQLMAVLNECRVIGAKTPALFPWPQVRIFRRRQPQRELAGPVADNELPEWI